MIRVVVIDTLKEYTQFMENVAAWNVDISSAMDVKLTRDTSVEGVIDLTTIQRESRYQPLFLFDICVDSEDSCINQKEVDARAAEIAAWKPPEDEKDAECDLEPVTPIMGKTFRYNYSLREAAEAVGKCFDDAMNAAATIPQVEHQVMDGLFWSHRPKCSCVGPNEDGVRTLRSRLDGALERVAKPLEDYLACFEKHVTFLNEDVTELVAAFEPAVKDDISTIRLVQLCSCVDAHAKARKIILEVIPAEIVELGLVNVSAATIRLELEQKHAIIEQKLLKLLAKHIGTNVRRLTQSFEAMAKQLQAFPRNVEEVAKLQEYVGTVPGLIEENREYMEALYSDFDVLESYSFQAPPLFNGRWEVRQWPRRIQKIVERTEATIAQKKQQYSLQMADEQVVFEQSLAALEAEVRGFASYQDIRKAKDVEVHRIQVSNKLDEARKQKDTFNSREILFGQEMTDYSHFDIIVTQWEPFDLLWKTTYAWLSSYESWMHGPFDEVDGFEVETAVDELNRAIVKSNKMLSKANMQACADIASEVGRQIDAFAPNVPFVMGMRNPGMRDRHWDQLSESIGQDIHPAADPDFTLQTAFDMELHKHGQLFASVGATAGKEYQIEQGLDKMRNEWKTIELQIVPYEKAAGYSILKGVDELMAILDEQLTATQAMSFSPFKGPFEERIELWNRTLQLMSDSIDEWIGLQRNWLYLQPIFSSDDIQKQLPAESKRFRTVDKNWRRSMSNALKSKDPVAVCGSDKQLKTFQEGNKLLDLVQKGLSEYLEQKRTVFTRFYFLSNDELLSILSQTKDVTKVQPHLKKCFEGINRVTFNKSNIIENMISREKEVMPLSTPVDPSLTGGVEFWMTELEDMMRVSVRDHVEAAIVDYDERPRPKWMQKWQGMCVLNCSQVHWTKQMEEAMAKDGTAGVKKMLAQTKAQLADMTKLVRGKLSKNARTSIGALTVIDVHARDVTIGLITEGVSKKTDFLWLSQMRYYWQDDDLWVQMVAARRPYGYEYLGNSFRLVITPLTDKCYLTLMGALEMILGGAPAGPAGTGKTETTKDLAKALAKQCVVFNCSDGLDYQQMGKFFKGLASCGAWACFDEFNRIEVEVLSVVAQQIIALQTNVRAGNTELVFEGSKIRLDAAFSVFITMNPGYAGRAELPDNLKACFRPVAMMVPDYALIGEIMLFAYGFDDSKSCAAKMVATFTLCSEQLSAQYHYDYGMRAVKTVITAAGNLKRANPDGNELQLILRAIQDVNLPKFLAQDLPLFDGIISDLFPGIDRPDIDYGALMQSLKLSCEAERLQPVEFFLKKNIQLYETLVVRHGLMVVGPTGAGKSENLKVLSRSLTQLNDFEIEGNLYNNIRKIIMNPKSITMGQLYGEFDPNTREFIDGVLPNLYRKASEDTTPDRKWVIFDGPVDAIWIENMNTVLDDNKKLCLNSGEMLQMSDTMSMIFEVDDLSVASPATVSRCGMVYMEPGSLGTDPLVRSWLADMPPEILNKTKCKEKLRKLFDTYMTDAITFVKRYCEEPVLTTTNNLAQSLMRILDTFLYPCRSSPTNAIDPDEGVPAEVLQKLEDEINSLFIFSLVWSVGGCVDTAGRFKFSNWLRSKMDDSAFAIQQKDPENVIPESGLVYDYVVDETSGKWVPWIDPSFVFEPHMDKNQFNDIVVPTKDTVRSRYLLQKLLSNRSHVLLSGDTGTSKTTVVMQYLAGQGQDGARPATKLERNALKRTVPLTLSFSAQTSVNQTQDILDSKMEKRKRGVFGPPAGQEFVIFVDDLNMPQREKYFAQPPLELLRQAMSQGGWYDRKSLEFSKIIDWTLVAAMGPPGGGRNPISSRTKQRFNIITLVDLDDKSKSTIYSTIMCDFFASGKFSPSVQALGNRVLADATIEIYNKIMGELLPTPTRPHYTFNLRDLSSVFQGMTMATASKVMDKCSCIRLWLHECRRVFRDRLINTHDCEWFDEACREQLSVINVTPLRVAVTKHNRRAKEQEGSGVDTTEAEGEDEEDVDESSASKSEREETMAAGDGGVNNEDLDMSPIAWEDVVPGGGSIVFTDCVSEDGSYEFVEDKLALQKTIEEFLERYNEENPKAPMRLVMFLDAIGHVCRLVRVLRQPQGNALCLGVGGSGRQSLTRLATFVREYTTFQVEIKKGYSMSEWREDVKTCLLKAGLQQQPCTFLFTDTQIVNEQMVEDINNILNSGDLPNLYGTDEMEQIMTTCRGDCQKKKIPPTKINIFSQYISRVRENTHVVFCMSPLGDDFRRRLRMFPSLVNCCTIDWFMPWPEDALRSVAHRSLSEFDLQLDSDGSQTNLNNLVEIFKAVHQSVEGASRKFFSKLRRYNYVTPTSYLALLQTYKTCLQEKRKEVGNKRDRIDNGLEKLIETKTQVADMQKTLVALGPQLEKTSAEVDAMMVSITKDKASAAETKAEVEAVAAAANAKAEECTQIATSAQADLDKALPALDEAVKCLDDLKKSDLDEIKALQKPPSLVKLTMEALCIMFQVKPNKVKDPNGAMGKKINDYFGPSKQQLLNDPKGLLSGMKKFDKDNIPDKLIKGITPYIEDPTFTPENVAKASKACTAICMWCRAMHTYHFVAIGVAPKRAALAAAEQQLGEARAKLAAAEEQLAAVMKKIHDLETSYDNAVAKKQELEEEMRRCQIRLDSAMKLIGGLGGEEARWKVSSANLKIQFGQLIGSVVIPAGHISYLGAFTSEFRAEMSGTWADTLVQLGLPHSEGKCTLNDVLADPVEVRSWQICGLPTDDLSTENGIVMSKSSRWPLLIDPQGQANRYIKNMAKEVMQENFDVIKESDSNFLRTLENGVRYGKWIILENIGESLDATLEPILLRRTFKQGAQLMMRIGDNNVPYNDSFRFFLTTKLSNPHYAPEVCVKVTLLNFAITPTGLEEQLLGALILEELPEVAAKKNALVVSNARMAKELEDIENKILQLLSEAEGNILDNVDIINALDEAKATSNDIEKKMEEAVKTEKEIDISRNNYRPVAYRATTLFFCITELARVDPMYQYSLLWFTQLFVLSIKESEPAPGDLKKRLENLNDAFTYILYENVCRSLFEKHKLLFSFMLCIKILQSRDLVDGNEWRFLISGYTTGGGGGGEDEEELANPASAWLTERAWKELSSLSSLSNFRGLCKDFCNNVDAWKELFDGPSPQDAPFPGDRWNALDSFRKLLVLRCLRPDKVTEAMQLFITEKLGQKFIEPPPFDLPLSFKPSTVRTPLIFVLSAGSDPMKDVLAFAESMKMGKRFDAISLGQGQGPRATKMVETGMQKGNWVLLQNCHLMTSWMSELEKICEEIDPAKVHKDFRLWLSSMPDKKFPVAVLQDGVKMTNEPPKGLKANLRATYYKLDEEQLEDCDKVHEYRKLLYSLSFFHAVMIERKKYGALGWNGSLSYEFNDTDYDICRTQLRVYLDQYDEVPYTVLRLLTAYINYGGRITDDKDMRTAEVIMNLFYNEDVLKEGYEFSESGIYVNPEYDESDPYQSYVDSIVALPLNAEPEVFGMHDNANITCAQNETYGMFDVLLSLQPRSSGGDDDGNAGPTREDIICAAAKDIEDSIPLPYDEEAVEMAFPVMYEESMNTVLVQECKRFNRLLRVMSKTLFEVQRALKGLAVMSGELESLANSISDQKVPEIWVAVAYPSLKPLLAWCTDLLARLKFLQDWIDGGTPKAFWISGFFFPQAFVTGTRQNYARKMQLAIDTISFDYLAKDSTCSLFSHCCRNFL